MEKVCFCEGFFFEVVMFMLKDKKEYIIKDTMSVKNNFMHYMEWIRVMLPVFFEELELVCIFFLSLSLSIVKRSTLAKIWGSSSPPLPPIASISTAFYNS